jgi:hypothetical protein
MRPFGTMLKPIARRTLSRLEAFKAQGVAVKYPARSWSGVRWEDGVVVFAIRDADVQAHEEAFSCLLWSPGVAGETNWVDRCQQERLEHCCLAALHGGADGFLVCGEAARVQPNALVALHVEKRRNEYWATWGSAARLLALGTAFNASMALAEARIAA